MRKYDTYKDSGIEWIGEIPSHWDTARMKFHLNYQKGKNPKELKFSENENSEVYLAMDYLRGNPKQMLYVEDVENYVRVDDNEILLLWDGSNAGEFVLSKKGILSSTMAILSLNNIQKDFSWYFFKHFEPQLKESTIGMGVPHVNGEELKNGFIAIPPPVEQTAIATYLDRKTAEIDELIADKKRLLELYEEEKTAIINELVTGKKVWNGNAWTEPVEVKDSGIEWLGEIPAHWEVKKLKHVAILKSGNSIVSEQIKESGEYPVYGGNGLRGYFSEFTHDGSHVLIGRQGAYCGNIKYGYSKFWASEHAVVVSPTVDYEIVYLGELLRTMNLGQYSVSAAQPGLAVDMIKNLFIPFPSRNEQQSIVRHIETESALINSKKAKTEKLIDLLTEYRTALISEVVTGKIKVI
jgi:type I restriction enzyme S subunit